jgi:predicted enzyme related to lactoylglutathione lyase
MGVTLGFDVPDLNKACKSLEQHGVLTQPATDDESGRYAVFTDPEGHKVKITESSR